MKRQIDVIVKQYQQSAWNFYRRKQKFDKVKKQYEELKLQFETDMLECCDEIGKKRITFIDGDALNADEVLTVSKVEKTSIEWNAERLEKKLPKSVVKKVIRKQYHITNMPGMIEYLKSFGVNPQGFKRFLTIDRVVDQQALEQLSNVGEISTQQISGCYIVKCQKPYFTSSVKKVSDNAENE